MIFDVFNRPSMLDTLPLKLLIYWSTSCSGCHDNEADANSDAKQDKKQWVSA